jgi:cell division septation protein DedD
VLNLNENGQIIFAPNTNVNYLVTSFGLSSVVSEPINSNKGQIKAFIPIIKKEAKKGIPTFIKYAASAAILLTLSFVGTNLYQQDKQQTLIANQEKALNKKIQTATFVIPNPLPAIKLNVVKKATVNHFHVVAGAFQFPINAEKKVKHLKKLGYNASILGVNKWGLTEVAFNSFADRNAATNNLYKIQATVSKDAWLLIKK